MGIIKKLKTIRGLKKGLCRTIAILSATGLMAISSPNLCAQESTKSLHNLHAQEYTQPIQESKIEKNLEQKKEVPTLIGSIYGEAGKFGGDIFDESPAFLNVSTGYNILGREKKDCVQD